ncbi:hypothetical protein J2Z69_001296 [Paenibacillus shirakamiensis]|uniref:Lipoprotein n=1 Tax=Paenibacillus shirakamiensis TaxID=1265935 RepID=A0ABS4JEY5_9BACL|nr:hypothetical protein [Paenibacillus shirakamiensis]MBP2000277.1 hypothetical protein [Paenibacillus shirakamiensis]
MVGCSDERTKPSEMLTFFATKNEAVQSFIKQSEMAQITLVEFILKDGHQLTIIKNPGPKYAVGEIVRKGQLISISKTSAWVQASGFAVENQFLDGGLYTLSLSTDSANGPNTYVKELGAYVTIQQGTHLDHMPLRNDIISSSVVISQ